MAKLLTYSAVRVFFLLIFFLRAISRLPLSTPSLSGAVSRTALAAREESQQHAALINSQGRKVVHFLAS